MPTPTGADGPVRTSRPGGAPEPGDQGPYGHSTPYGRSGLSPPAPAGPELAGSNPDVGDQPDHPRPGARRRWLLIAAVLVALAATAVLSYRWGSGARPQAMPTPTPSASATPLTTAEIYAAVGPSVVSVLAADGAGSGNTGTGVIVSEQAVILTALHVVNGAAGVRVVFADGTEADAIVVGSDPATDTAMLQPLGLPEVVVPVVLGSAGGLEVGDRVIAIGDQLGLTRTTTEGVVSGLDRTAPGFAGGAIDGLIQFDAAVNHGSSGGPLVNADGALVGIVVALANPTEDGTFIGISFAVPIGVAVAAGGGQIPQ